MKSKMSYSKIKSSSNPIKDCILFNKTFPEIKEFTQKYKPEDIIPENIDIRKIVSEYFNKLGTIEEKCHEIINNGKGSNILSNQFLHQKNKKIFNDIDKNLSAIMGKNFDNLKQKVKLHTDVFCYLFTVIEKEFVNKHFYEYDLNIIYWTILFHDIAKFRNMHPVLEKNMYYGSTDGMHPYKSAMIFINTLLEKKLIEISEDEQKNFNQKYEKFKKKIFDSYKSKISGFHFDIKYFKDIIEFVKYLRSLGEKNSWLCDVFILIVFHQNLPNNKFHMNPELLTKEQIMDVFDLRLLEMMRIIMVLDSLSHQVFDPTEWTSQINIQLDIVRTYYNTKNNDTNNNSNNNSNSTDNNSNNNNNNSKNNKNDKNKKKP